MTARNFNFPPPKKSRLVSGRGMWYHTQQMTRQVRQIPRGGEAEGRKPLRRRGVLRARRDVLSLSRWRVLSRCGITAKMSDFAGGGALNSRFSALRALVERAAGPFSPSRKINHWRTGVSHAGMGALLRDRKILTAPLAGRGATCCDRMGSHHLGCLVFSCTCHSSFSCREWFLEFWHGNHEE